MKRTDAQKVISWAHQWLMTQAILEKISMDEYMHELNTLRKVEKKLNNRMRNEALR